MRSGKPKATLHPAPKPEKQTEGYWYKDIKFGSFSQPASQPKAPDKDGKPSRTKIFSGNFSLKF